MEVKAEEIILGCDWGGRGSDLGLGLGRLRSGQTRCSGRKRGGKKVVLLSRSWSCLRGCWERRRGNKFWLRNRCGRSC